MDMQSGKSRRETFLNADDTVHSACIVKIESRPVLGCSATTVHSHVFILLRKSSLLWTDGPRVLLTR